MRITVALIHLRFTAFVQAVSDPCIAAINFHVGRGSVAAEVQPRNGERRKAGVFTAWGRAAAAHDGRGDEGSEDLTS